MVKKYKRKKKERANKTKTHYHLLTETDRITYSYELGGDNSISKIVNVSYEVEIENKWTTIIRFDSEHGKMHCHMMVSLQDPEEVVVPSGWIIKKGRPKDWLTWAMKHLRKKFLNYRVGFFKRSKIKQLY
ncbi:MAG: hypothetical protein UX67_C0003G0006 [Candidatus Woesebacteria bacterium GW2011_GWF2_46_8]|uniref:DUF7718 domain-containing protein n=1 Tax=Candidatus Woesebacteria bacterium GW2011_GWF2_46_8 TaxID=1618604 RepID=A0A0G1QW93_9BACT|nr:MAG: hypothetical protein UX67_C0003G0006 [Candidatus Woesebacteria bacterium GW2011_GWF2_46_8]